MLFTVIVRTPTEGIALGGMMLSVATSTVKSMPVIYNVVFPLICHLSVCIYCLLITSLASLSLTVGPNYMKNNDSNFLKVINKMKVTLGI